MQNRIFVPFAQERYKIRFVRFEIKESLHFLLTKARIFDKMYLSERMRKHFRTKVKFVCRYAAERRME